MDIVTFEEYKTKVDELEEQVRNHDESIRKLTGIVSYLLGEVERRGVGTYRGQPVPVPEPDPEPDADPVPEPEPEPDADPVPEPEPLPEFPEPDQAAVSAADMKSYIQRMAESGQIANVLSPDGSLPRDLGVTGKGEYVPLHPVPEPDPDPDADPVPEPEPHTGVPLPPFPEPEPHPGFHEPDQAAVSAADMKSYIQRMAESGQIANVLSPDGSLPRDLGVTGKGEYVPLHPVPEPDPEPGGRVYILPKGEEKIRFRRLLSSHRPHPSGGGKKKKNVSKTRKKKSRKRKSHNRIKKYKRRLK